MRGNIINKHTEHLVNEVNLDQEFSLSPGQSAKIAGENLVIKFVEVISDGRCPRGAICIWPGEANCLTEITTRPESIYLKVLTQESLRTRDSSEALLLWKIKPNIQWGGFFFTAF